MGNSYRHGLGHKCSRWRPRVHPVNTYLLMVTWIDMASLSLINLVDTACPFLD